TQRGGGGSGVVGRWRTRMTDRQSDSIDSVVSRWPWWRMFPRRSPSPEPRLRTLPLDPLPPRADADPEREAWGICLSGGGIRSAAYSLGVLQEMEEHEMLSGPRRAWYLSVVSGGSYIGGAFTMIARGAYPDEAEGSTQTICPV